MNDSKYDDLHCKLNDFYNALAARNSLDCMLAAYVRLIQIREDRSYFSVIPRPSRYRPQNSREIVKAR